MPFLSFSRFGPTAVPALALALILSLASAATAAAAGIITGPVRVIDGDTLEIGDTRIRLHGIDAPESAQLCNDQRTGLKIRCGAWATSALETFIDDARVACSPRTTDRYGRVIAVCRTDGIDINQWMVRAGFAMAYRRYSADYIRAEEAAKAERRGIWMTLFTPPWEWRRAQGD